MRHIGIAAVTAEGAALCYRTIVAEASRRLGPGIHPEITLHTHSFRSIVDAQRRDDWAAVADLLAESLGKLKGAGADFAIIPANSVHFAFDAIRERSPIPVLSIVETAAGVCRKKGYRQVLTLGVGITMSRGLFDAALAEQGTRSSVPDPVAQERINAIIYDQIVPSGKADDASLSFLAGLIGRARQQGCDAALLGCTELPLVLTGPLPLPIIDTTLELALRAVDEALA